MVESSVPFFMDSVATEKMGRKSPVSLRQKLVASDRCLNQAPTDASPSGIALPPYTNPLTSEDKRPFFEVIYTL